MKDRKELNVVFLVDRPTPTKVVLLKRSPTKSYAPGWYTGIGGKVGDQEEFAEETPLESAYRELREETDGDLREENITLHEFARCRYDDGLTLYYFWGIYQKDELPNINSEDGELFFVETENLLDYKIIPTTHEVCKEWARRDFRTDSPFTVHLRHSGMDESVRLVELMKVEEGLK